VQASPAADSVAATGLERQFPRPSGPLDLRVIGKDDWDGVPVRHVTYRSEGAVVTATLSLPDDRGPFPAVLFAPGVMGRREMFAADVAALQRDGIAALAVDPPDGRDPFVRPITVDPEEAAEAHGRYVADLRRGFDVLRSLPEVDPDRLGYVGYSWGGFVGGYLAGLGEPVRAYVLTYAGADWVGADPTAADGFAADPAEAVAAGAPGAYLFIAGVDDFLFSRESVTRYSRAADGDTRLVWLPGGHGDYWALPDGAAQVDHLAWLERHL
jgi:dienelactone hydrolase